jgi:hypothetical protein
MAVQAVLDFAGVCGGPLCLCKDELVEHLLVLKLNGASFPMKNSSCAMSSATSAANSASPAAPAIPDIPAVTVVPAVPPAVHPASIATP